MAYTGTQLITGAYYASGIVARDFETVSGSQAGDGLVWLNELIGKKIIEPDLIPYEGSTTFTGVVGQEDYQVNNLIKPDTVTFVKQDVRYKLDYIPRDQYRGSTRVNNINSMPYQYYYERNFDGASISLYFKPNEAYTFTIYGIFRLSEVTAAQDLSLTLNRFYITFLRYELAEKICTEYGMPVPSNVEREVNAYRALISKQSRPLDLAIRKRSTLQQQQLPYWAWVNLGDGWLPD
jgi:hypothetical protein